jgi:hypothetical protein
LGSAAVLVITGGKILVEWGDTARRFPCHSMRKVFSAASSVSLFMKREEVQTLYTRRISTQERNTWLASTRK